MRHCDALWASVLTRPAVLTKSCQDEDHKGRFILNTKI